MNDDKSAARGNGDASDRVAFDYIKSEHFRVIRADGAIGGVTPNGTIHMAFYSERLAIPRRVVYELGSNGRLGKEIESEKVSRDSIVREMDVDLFINLDTAIALHEWLGHRIADAQNRGEGTTKETGAN